MSVQLINGRAQVRTGKVELGQGLHTALAQIVADELGLAFADVQMLPVDTTHSPDQGVTSGSLSVQDAGQSLRQACALLRGGAPAPVVARPAVGQSLLRPELTGLFAGRPFFIHDLQPAGLLHGRVLHTSAAVLAWDEAAARAAPGLLHLLRDGELFGVVAADTNQVDAAFDALQKSITWQTAAALPDEDAAALCQLPASTRVVFDSSTEPSPQAPRLQRRYSKPWIAHASIAPSCALALWQGTQLQVWTHSQGIFNLRRDLALAFSIDVHNVSVCHVPGAGCYGHNGADDVAFDAAWLARTVPGHTLRVLWSRADELTHAPFGPAMVVDIDADFDDSGRITRWQQQVRSPGHSRRPGRSATPALLGAWQTAAPFVAPPSIDMPLTVGGGAERNAVPGYHIGQIRALCHSVQTQRRSSALRAFANVFAAESFFDEIAHRVGACPLALRLQHLQHDPRALAVLNAAAARAGWGTHPREEGVGHGLAFARYKGTGAWCAVVAQVCAGATLQVLRLSIAVDVGLAINPDGVVAQIEGGAIQATSWVLKEQAAAALAGWADYPILRFSEVPEVDVLVMPSAEQFNTPSLGAGEAALGPTAGAINNALFDALGVRVRNLPLSTERITAAIHATSPT